MIPPEDLFAEDPVQTVTWRPSKDVGHSTAITVAGRRFYAAMSREMTNGLAEHFFGADKVETVKRGGRVEWSRPHA